MTPMARTVLDDRRQGGTETEDGAAPRQGLGSDAVAGKTRQPTADTSRKGTNQAGRAATGTDRGAGQRMTPPRWLAILGLAQRAHAVASGRRAATAAVRNGDAKLVLLAQDVSAPAADQLSDLCRAKGVTCVRLANKDELGAALGRAPRAVLAVTDAGLAHAMSVSLPRAARRDSAEGTGYQDSRDARHDRNVGPNVWRGGRPERGNGRRDAAGVRPFVEGNKGLRAGARIESKQQGRVAPTRRPNEYRNDQSHGRVERPSRGAASADRSGRGLRGFDQGARERARGTTTFRSAVNGYRSSVYTRPTGGRPASDTSGTSRSQSPYQGRPGAQRRGPVSAGTRATASGDASHTTPSATAAAGAATGDSAHTQRATRSAGSSAGTGGGTRASGGRASSTGTSPNARATGEPRRGDRGGTANAARTSQSTGSTQAATGRSSRRAARSTDPASRESAESAGEDDNV